jgi:tRNA/rRNA methyltransferase
MANMGLSDLSVVSPRNLDMNEARMMACHATDILGNRTTVDTLAEAVADCGCVVGTTARGGLYRQHAQPPRELAPHILDIASGGRVAVVFGREDNGLENDELALCTKTIQIPTADTYTSINLAQAVLLCCYELFVATDTYEPPEEKSEDAPSELRERMFEIWRDTLMQVGFMKDDKADHMMMGIRRILGRGRLTVDDVHILMGMARQCAWAASGRPSRKDLQGTSAGPECGVGRTESMT